MTGDDYRISTKKSISVIKKLGVEHVWASADIPKKRKYKKKSICMARKPDLGMIPILMAGDKVCKDIR